MFICSSESLIANGTTKPSRFRRQRLLVDLTSLQVLDIVFEVCLVVLPRPPIHAGGCVLRQRVERLLEEFNGDVVEQRGEPLLFVAPPVGSHAARFSCRPQLRRSISETDSNGIEKVQGRELKTGLS